MSMKVEGGSNESNPKRYTMEDLNIPEGSPAASIFNRIDKQDGHEDGYLTEDQYKEYAAEIDKFKIDLDKKIVKNESKNKEHAAEIDKFKRDLDKKIVKNESKNKGNAFVRFIGGFSGLIIVFSYFLRHGKLHEKTHSDKENNFQKENINPKLAEREKKIKKEFGEK